MRKKTIEDYVEEIYNLQNEKGRVKTNDIALALDITPASVTEIFQKLSNEGYIHYKKYNGVNLTKKGELIAVETLKRHDTLKKFLMILGITEETANEDACRIEHVVNKETMNRLKKFVDFVTNLNDVTDWFDRFKYFYETGEIIKKNKKIK